MKPHWPRTLQLQPAHLHARDGHVEDRLTLRTGYCVGDAYGVLALALDTAAGARGEVVVQRLEAILPGGMVVRVEPQAPLRRVLPEAAAGASISRDVFVAVPRQVLRGPNVTPEGGPARSTRYLATPARSATELAALHARPELLFQEEVHEGVETVRIGRVQSFGKSLRFTRDGLPTVLRLRASAALEEDLRRLVRVFEGRRQELVRYRAGHPLNLSSVLEADLPALQLSVVLQRYLPLLVDLEARRSAHPHELYEVLVAAHGALSAFGLPEIPPAYDHDEPGRVFPWLFEHIERLVSVAARDSTTILPFRRVDDATFRLVFEPNQLAGKQLLLVLAGAEEAFLRERVPSLLKMASPTAITPLLNSAVGGVAVAVEFEPPPVVPRTRGTVAYRIDVRDRLWLDIEDRMQVQLSLVGAPASLEAFLYGVERLV